MVKIKHKINNTIVCLAVWLILCWQFLENFPLTKTRKDLLFDAKQFENPQLQKINSHYWRSRDTSTGQNTSKWIVLTASHYSYEEMEQISLLEGWQLVIVDEAGTRKLQKQNVHYVGDQERRVLGFNTTPDILGCTYARKNIGYLYAIKNGADWIYDIDLGVLPTNATLSIFDYTQTISGLQYKAIETASVSERHFNPFTFFGSSRRFPESYSALLPQDHNNCKDCMMSCRQMRTSAIQHGLPELQTETDSDVGQSSGSLSDESRSSAEVLSKFAPAVTLKGTFSPWSSPNTLFHRRAFFALFLPALKGRAPLIMRSFFAQKLLHILGDTTAIYPVQQLRERILRNNWKMDNAELPFKPSLEFLEFLVSWKCRHEHISECALALARDFRERHYWTYEDYLLLKQWLDSLCSLKYEFPAVNDQEEESTIPRYRNCRRAYVNFTTVSEVQLAQQKLIYLNDLSAWCGHDKKLDSVSAEELAILHRNNIALSEKRDTVLVIINNYPWRRSLGILQRLHQPYFGLIIFCGTFDKIVLEEEGFPPTIEGFSFIDVDEKEILRGVYLYYCLSKVAEMRLRNVKGYFVTADDLIWNLWNRIDLDFTYHPLGILNRRHPAWYNGTVGTPALQRAVKLLAEIYKDYPAAQAVRKRYEEGVVKYQKTTSALEYLVATTGYAASDFFYVPSTEIEFFSDLMQIFFEAGVFKGIAVVKFLASVQHVVAPRNKVKNIGSRKDWPNYYNSDIIMLHSLKPSYLKYPEEKRRYCAVLVRTFRGVLLKGKLR